MMDSGYGDSTVPSIPVTEELRQSVRYSVERRDAFSSDWYTVADNIHGDLTGKVKVHNCPKQMYGNEYRVTAWLNNQPCAPSRPARINIKTAELAPDLSCQKVNVDVSNVDEYRISYPEDKLESFFADHILASTLPQSLEEDLTFDVEAMKGNSKEWEKIATGLPSPSFAWTNVNPLLPYTFRIVGRNQFGVGQPSRMTHVDAQVVIPDLSFVVPTVREPSGVLEGREPAELRWQTPRIYSLTETFTPFTYEVQIRPVGLGEASNEWKVFKEGLKQPRCSLEGLDPGLEYALRVVAVTNFGRGEPSQPTRKRRGRGNRSLQSASSWGSLTSPHDSAPPQFEDPSPSVVYVPAGGDLDLRCTLTAVNVKTPVHFVWSFNFQEIPNLPKHEQFPSGYFQHVTGGGKQAQLRLFDLDERDFGTYTCKAVNAFGSTIKEFRVLRADAPVITEVPLPIITLPVHHTLLLPCWVDAVPPAKITWTRDSKRLTSSHRTWIGGETNGMVGSPATTSLDWSEEVEYGELSVDASLRVERCVFQDAGLYTMIAENPAGRAQTSCIVRVEETLTPRTITPRWSNIDKHYFVLHQIGTGSFSRAHLLIDKKTNREYVGKVYALDDVMTRVLGAREFECLNRLHHNNVLELVDTVISDDHLVLITERLTGNHLLEEVLLGHTWTEAAVAMLVKELLEAVAHVHAEGIVHLDIQPDNVIFPRGTSSRSVGLEGLMQALSCLSVDTTGAGGRSDLGVVSCFVKLTGFSMAQPVFDRSNLQLASIMPPPLWCPDFAAPELLRTTTSVEDDDHGSGVGVAADIWSVGIITYLLLFGEHPVIHKSDDTLNVEDVASIEDRLAGMTNSLAGEAQEDASPEAIDFLRHLLTAEPTKRPSATQCLRHPWFTESGKSARNLENSLQKLKDYQRIYQKRKSIPTDSWRRECFLKFAGEACAHSLPQPAEPNRRASSTQPQWSLAGDVENVDAQRSARGFSIDRDLTNRISTLMVPPKDRGGVGGSGGSSLRSSMLHLDITEFQVDQSPIESPSPRLDPWAGLRATSDSCIQRSRSPSLLSADDSSEPIKRLCDNISREREEQILPVRNCLCEGQIRPTSKIAPAFSNPLRDSHIDPLSNAVFFSCQLAGTPRFPSVDVLYQRKNRNEVDALGLADFAIGAPSGVGNVAAAWYLGGCLLTDGPGVMLGASQGGWLWLRLEDADRVQAGKVVECVVRSRNGKAKTQARILLPEPPSPPGRPGILQSASNEVLVAWTCGNDDSCEDFVYRVDLKYPDAKPIASAWRTVGYTVDRRYLITALEPDLAYRVRVSVRNAVGWSGYSIASSEFRLHSGNAKSVNLPEDERRWILDWRQASHPFGLSDHPEALAANRKRLPTTPSDDDDHYDDPFDRPPPSGIAGEIARTCGLFPHAEAVKRLCQTEGIVAKGSFGSKVLLRCHPALVERGYIPGMKQERQPFGLPAFVMADLTDVIDDEGLERRARQKAIIQTLVHSSAPTRASDGLEGAPMFSQQFSIRTPPLLQGLSLGWLANDAAKPTAGLSVSQWISGGPLIDVLLARGEYTEFSVARWTCQLTLALRWLHTTFHGRLHGRVDFDHVHAARRSSTLPDLVLTGLEPVDGWVSLKDCFTAPELDSGGRCNALSDLWSLGAFAYFLLLAESFYTTSATERDVSRTPTPTGDTVAERGPSKNESKTPMPGGYKHLDRPEVNLKAIKQLSKWGRRFVYNALQADPMSRGTLDFWLEGDWFSLRPEIVKQLSVNTIPSKYLRVFQSTETSHGVIPLRPGDADPLSMV
uniref:Fibronectin type III domain protein n=1 Tax=Mesocestoides corti TaxID=53468 RepID=A0A5K3FEF2_MESCO